MIKHSSKFFVFLSIIFFTTLSVAEDCVGPIHQIKFEVQLNLSYDSLIRGIDISPGSECDLVKIADAVTHLKNRRIFQNIEYRLERNSSNELVLSFKLIPNNVLSEIEFFGNSDLLTKDLKRAILNRSGDVIDSQSAEVARQKLETYYIEQGYFDAKITVDQRFEDTIPLVSFLFWIEEGRPRRVRTVEIQGEGLESIKSEIEDIISVTEGAILTKYFQRKLRQNVYQILRDSGFYQARIRIASDGEIVKYNIDPKSSLSFKLEGANSISKSDLLSSLKLDSRLVPLRANITTSLCEDIRYQYRRAGYFDAIVECSQDGLTDGGEILIKVNEGNKFKVLPPLFIGNHQIKEEDLLAEVSYRYSIFRATLSPTLSTIENDSAKIRYVYAKQGFEGVDVKGDLDVDTTNQTIREKFIITERGEVLIAHVKCDIKGGDIDGFIQECEEKTSDLNGKRYEEKNLINLNEEFKQLLIEEGYATAKLTVAFDSSTSTLDLEIEQGKKVKVEKIICAGNYFTQDSLILRELRIEEGDVWDSTKIDASKQSLFGLGVFSSVQIGPLDGILDSEDEVLLVRVREKETGLLQGLFEMSTQDGLHLQTQLAQRNLFGTGQALVLGIDGYFKQGFADFDAARTRLAFASPRIFSSNLDYTIEGFYQTALNLNRSFKLDREGVTQSLRYPFLENLGLSISQTFYGERLHDVSDDLILGPRDVGNTFYSGIRGSLELDKRDDPFVTTRGYRLEIGGGFLPEALGSETGIVEGHFDGSSVFPVSVNNSYAIHLRGGFLEALNEDVVPLGSRYFLGGRDTIRGYTRYQVGPRSVNGLVVGGDTMVVFSQELRHNLGDGLTLLGFLDIAQAMLRNSSGFTGDTKYRLDGLRYSPGVGMQYATPIGPLAAELGLATDREFGERWGRFIVSIGNAF